MDKIGTLAQRLRLRHRTRARLTRIAQTIGREDDKATRISAVNDLCESLRKVNVDDELWDPRQVHQALDEFAVRYPPHVKNG